jgi:YidC/Oxa1 family membrane protein insertase
MNIRQVFLYCTLAIVGMFLWKSWVKDHPSFDDTVSVSAPENIEKQNYVDYVPSTYKDKSGVIEEKVNKKTTVSVKKIAFNKDLSRLIYAQTDLFRIGFSPKGGNIVFFELLKYPVSLDEKNTPFRLLSSHPDDFFVTQSGLTSSSQTLIFNASHKYYRLGENDNEIFVKLTGRSKNGLLINKIYRLERNKYAISLKQKVTNLSSKAISSSFYTQIQRKKPQSKSGGGVFKGRIYDGAALSSPEKRYRKISYHKMDQANLSQNIKDGWIAMQMRYFVSALIPPTNQTVHYYTRSYENDIYTVGFVSYELKLAPGKTTSFQTEYYIGPKINSRLNAVAKGLDLTINYGWLWMISDAIFWVMEKINWVIGNWGWTIVLITALIKLLFYPLSSASFRSMARMHNMQPRIQALKDRYADDKKGLSQATMELYRKEKINPLGGCLPMLIQIPVFIALYYVLIESVQLRQAPFIFWIHDLSAKDPYYILPILMGCSMFLTQKLSSVSVDPNQAKMMLILPLVFTVLFANFPAGLVLYWLVNNCVQGIQQWYVMRKVSKTPHYKRKK